MSMHELEDNPLFIGQVSKSVFVPLSLDILIRPSFLPLHILHSSYLLLVQSHIDPSEEKRYPQLNGEENHDGDFSRNIAWRILRLEYLGPYDIPYAKGNKSQGANGTPLRVTTSVTSQVSVNRGQSSPKRVTEVNC